MKRNTAPLLPVILLGGYDNGLSVARSLGPSGIAVYAAGCGRSLRYSRWIRWLPHEETGTTQETWLRWLLREGDGRFRGAVLFPCNDEAVELVAREQERLSERFLLSESNPPATLAMLDKGDTAAIAERLGIPAPWVRIVRNREELLASLPALTFPCALKPRHSHRFHRHYGIRKLFVASSPGELIERFAETERLGLEMLVTEIIPGRNDECFGYWTYRDGRGTSLYHFTKRKLRQYPVHFGIGTLHVSEWQAEAAALGRRFVEGSGLLGPAVVELKRDARDGRLKLIECNPRFVNPHELAARAGLDVSRLVYDHLTGRPPRTPAPRRPARLWFPVRDLRAFRAYRALGELTLREWSRSLWPGAFVAQFRWSDPLPLLAPLFERLAKRLARRGGLPSPNDVRTPDKA